MPGAKNYDEKGELQTAEHGRRLGTFIMALNGLSDEYQRGPHDGFQRAHQHSKRCPMRANKHKEAVAFTVQQRSSWLGNLALACETKQAPQELKEELLSWARNHIGFYGPWVQE